MERKILVVDDDELTLKSIKTLLQKYDWSVDICSDPLKALERICNAQYGCLLLDVRMPQLSGLELFEKIRDLEKQGRVSLQQVIFLTGYADESVYIKALEHGAFNFLYKPFDAEDLLKRIENCINAKKIIEASYSEQEESHTLLGKKYDFLLTESTPDIRTEHLEQITLEDIGAKINVISPGELFWWYAKAGFFYPSKKRKLTPYLSLVEENWKKAIALGEEIFWIATVSDLETKSWASICNWRSTFSGWVSQHLIASGNAAYPIMLMLGTQLKVIKEADIKPYYSFQNWYRPTNKYANKVFGILERSVRKEASFNIEFRYFMIDPRKLPVPAAQSDIRVVSYNNKNARDFVNYLQTQRNSVYISSEEFDGDDIELIALNDIYQKVGLQRKRSFWLAFHMNGDVPIGAIIAYRAPVGLNFSMLENRVELIISENVSEQTKADVCCALLQKAGVFYGDFPAPFIPLVTEEKNCSTLSLLGFTSVRSYNQFIWTKYGYQDWYNTLYTAGLNAINRWRKYKCNR